MPSDVETILAFVERVEREHVRRPEREEDCDACSWLANRVAYPCDALLEARALREMAAQLHAEAAFLPQSSGPAVRRVLKAGAAALKEG